MGAHPCPEKDLVVAVMVLGVAELATDLESFIINMAERIFLVAVTMENVWPVMVGDGSNHQSALPWH